MPSSIRPSTIRETLRYSSIRETIRGDGSGGGIIIPDTAKEKPQEAEVVAVGDGALGFCGVPELPEDRRAVERVPEDLGLTELERARERRLVRVPAIVIEKRRMMQPRWVARLNV